MLINASQANSAFAAVTGAIRDAARATGASFEYLLATARAESGLDPQAIAKSSSARGLFQFVDRTWLATLKQAGPALGYDRFANAITQSADGQLEVPDPAMRAQISALRNDPAASAAMAGAFTQQNANRLAGMLGRQATEGELYIAHFLGAEGAGRLISLATGNPMVPAADQFPKAAAANPAIFYERTGAARSVGDVYLTLTSRFDRAKVGGANAAASRAAPVDPVLVGQAPGAAPAATQARSRSLFADMANGEQRREPVSQIVRELWTTRPHVAAALSGSQVPPSGGAPAASSTARAAAGEGWRNLYRDLVPRAR